MKVYKLVKPILFSFWVILLLMTGIGLFMVFQGFQSGEIPPGVRGVTLLWLGFLAWIWYFYLKIPFEIRLRDDNVLEFVSVIKTTVVAPRDLISIKGALLNLGFIKVKHTGGTIRLLSQITGLYEVIYTVKALNPDIEIVGC
jgi:hypothetical protein